MRLFIAIPLPQAALAALEQTQQALRERLRDFSSEIRWATPEQMHLTLRFLGDVEEGHLANLTNACADAVAQSQSFQLQLQSLGCFPNPSRPRVVWVGVAGDLDSLQQLHGRIIERTRHFGQPPENRPFRAHLTLGRVREGSRLRDLRPALQEIPPPNAATWPVNSIHLIRSHLSSQGARYEIVARFGVAPILN